MGDENQRGAALGIDFEHQLDDLMAGRGVEIAGRLIGQHQPWARGKGTRQGDALLFPTGEMFRIVSQAVRQSNPLQPVLGLGSGIGGAGQFERQHDVLDGIQRGQQLEGLENKAQHAAAQNRPRILVQATEILASQGHRTAARQVEAGQQASRVDFPEPEAPTIATVSPAATANEISCRMVNGSPPLSTRLARSFTSTTIAVSRTMSLFRKYRHFLLAGLMLLTATVQAAGTILVFGDSLSAGYGIRQDAAWPALLARRLQEKRLDYSVVNASISGETTSGGRTRIEAALARHSPRVVIVALGANDGLRGLPVAQCATT
jgi:hypothetical protein